MSTPFEQIPKGSPLANFDQHQLEMLLRDGWRLTPATMAVKITQGRWKPAAHLLHISTIVATAIRAGNKFIIVTMPPRHGKSEFLSVNTSIWHLDTFPDKRIILASYGADLATEFALKVRDTFQDEDIQPLLRTRIRKDRSRIDNFKTVDGGGMISIGVGGAATGKGADLFLVDDYVKNAEEALSASQRQKAWDWFLSTAYTRLEPNATTIVLATRWDRKDLIGMIMEKMAELEDAGFEPPIVINLPALAREGDPLGRAVGEPLWPERYDLQALLRIKATLGTYWWDALYQQDPPASMAGANLGGKIKVIERSDMPHYANLRTTRAWDFAATEHGGDFTAGPLMHIDKDTSKIFISECFHKQISSMTIEHTVAQTAENDGAGVSIWIEQEPGSAGKAIIEHYQHDVIPAYSLRGEKNTGPIEVRCQPFLAAVEEGRVHVVKAPWVPFLVNELDGFPEADFDDILVACALGYRKLTKGKFGSIIWGRDSNREGRRPTINTRYKPKQRMGVVW